MTHLVRYGFIGRPKVETDEMIREACGEQMVPRSERTKHAVEALLRCGRDSRQTPTVRECRSGKRVPAKVLEEMKEILEGLQWPKVKKASTSSKRAVSTLYGSNFVLGATKGVKGSSGFSEAFSHQGPNGPSKPLGLNRNIVPTSMSKQASNVMRLWNLCKEYLKKEDPKFRFSSIQVNKNFSGDPHVDKSDVTYQYALSLGDFVGGRLVVSTDDPFEFVSLDTKDHLTRCDGRRAHWVTPFRGTRYSLIFYRITGHRTPIESNKSLRAVCRSVSPEKARPRRRVKSSLPASSPTSPGDANDSGVRSRLPK